MDDAGYGGFVSVPESTKVAYVCNFRAFSLSQTFTSPCVLLFSMSADIFKTSSKISISLRRRTLFGPPELLLFNLHTKMVVLRAWELTFRKSGAPASARCTFLEDWFPGFQPFIFQRNRKIAPDGPTPPKSLAYIIISGRLFIDFARLLSQHGLTYITSLTHLQTHSPT